MWVMKIYSDDSRKRFEQVKRDFATIVQRSQDLQQEWNEVKKAINEHEESVVKRTEELQKEVEAFKQKILKDNNNGPMGEEK